MGLGIRKSYVKAVVSWNILKYTYLKTMLGFGFAHQFLSRVDKQSLIKILRRNGATIGKDVDFDTGPTFHNCLNFQNLVIGDNCHIGKNCFFDLRDKITIGNNVVISMNTTLITHQDLNKSPLSKHYPAKSAAINIGDNCYIGAGCLLLMGVELEKNVITAAGSLILKNVESNVVVAGSPAQKIKTIR